MLLIFAENYVLKYRMQVVYAALAVNLSSNGRTLLPTRRSKKRFPEQPQQATTNMGTDYKSEESKCWDCKSRRLIPPFCEE